jgi:hypothetical protein
MKNKTDSITLTVNVKIIVSWGTAFKMFLIGRYPAAIIAKAMADKIREGK